MRVIALLVLCALGVSGVDDLNSLRSKLPTDLGDQPQTVLIALLVRNKAHVLPLFLTYLEALDYPKDRIAFWIRSDHNIDNSIELLELWIEHNSGQYHSVEYLFDNETQRHQNESSQYDWPLTRFRHLIALKEEALTYAQQIWADFIFYIDADVFLTSPHALTSLTRLKLPVVAPMLLSEGLYSNFWCGMTADYYYQRTNEYKEIYNVNKEGIFQVPMIHSAVLVDVNYKGLRYLTFDRQRLIELQENQIEWAATEGRELRVYDGPVDDIIVFAVSANSSNIPLFVSNEIPFGYILQPLETGDGLEQDLQQLINIRANIVHDLGSIAPLLDYYQPYISYPPKHKLTLDHIYMINLERRPERREKMEKLFLELGLDVEYFAAVDGKKLNNEIVKEMGIKFLPGYEDPYHRRAMTMGEIGCFLSHYKIWELMVEREQKEILILEDDIRFEPYFKNNAERVLQEARSVVDYDLIYFGRKRLKEESEPWVENTDYLVHAGYSYWTLGYVLSLQGARKLLAAQPLEKLIPVDEYLPLMFNRHPNKTWSEAYPVRDLIAFSAAPLLLYPTHYTGEVGYISDTEDSAQIAAAIAATASDNEAAQLKSDREMIYAPEERLPEQGLKRDLNNGNAEKSSLLRNEFNIDINVASHNEL